MSRKAAFHNLGCKVNSYEMDVMLQELKNKGYEIVPFEEKAKNCHSFGLPSIVQTQISCDISGKDIIIEADRSDIVTEESSYSSITKAKLDFLQVTKKAFRNRQEVNQ